MVVSSGGGFEGVELGVGVGREEGQDAGEVEGVEAEATEMAKVAASRNSGNSGDWREDVATPNGATGAANAGDSGKQVGAAGGGLENVVWELREEVQNLKSIAETARRSSGLKMKTLNKTDDSEKKK